MVEFTNHAHSLYIAKTQKPNIFSARDSFTAHTTQRINKNYTRLETTSNSSVIVITLMLFFFCWLLPLSLAISLTHSFSRTTFRSDCLIKPEKCYFTRSLLPSTLRFVVVAVVLYCILLMLFSSSFFLLSTAF